MKLLRLAAPTLCVLLGLSIPARGDDVVPPPAAIFHAGVASFTKLRQAMTILGLALPIDPQSWAEQLPFIGPGGVDTDQPGGIVTFASDRSAGSPWAYFAIPVSPGFAMIENLQAAGIQPVPNEPDMAMAANGAIFKRTADHLFFGRSGPDALRLATDADIAAPFADGHLLAFIDYDGKAMRAAAPLALRRFIENTRANARSKANPHENPSQQAGERYGQELVFRWLKHLDHFNLGCSVDPKVLHVTCAIGPGPNPVTHTFAAPIFRPQTIAAVNVVLPDATPPHWLSDDFRSLESVMPQDPRFTPTDFQDILRTVEDLCDIIGDAGSLSCAVEQAGGNHVVYTVVLQYTHDADAAGRLVRSVDRIGGIDRRANSKDKLVADDFTAPDHSPGIYIHDNQPNAKGGLVAVPDGNTLTLCFGDDAATIQAFAAKVPLSATEQLTRLASARINLGALRAVAQQHFPRWNELSTTLQESLQRDLGDKVITINATSTTSDLQISADLPVNCIRLGMPVIQALRRAPQ